MREIEELALAVECAVMDDRLCPHVGVAAYRRLRQLARLAEAGQITEARAQTEADAAFTFALTTERLPDVRPWDGEDRIVTPFLSVEHFKDVQKAIRRAAATAGSGALLLAGGGSHR